MLSPQVINSSLLPVLLHSSSSPVISRCALLASANIVRSQARFFSSTQFHRMSLPTTQTGFVFNHKTSKLEKKEIPVPEPKEGNILLKIKAAGLCHSDLHVLDATLPYYSDFVLGHEIVGHIAKFGPGVDKENFDTNKLYSVHGSNPCGQCNYCRIGQDNLCQQLTRAPYGLGEDGGYQQYAQFKVRNLIPVPDGIDPSEAAVATDAILTPYHAMKVAGVKGLTRVLIIGLGGLGINGVQVAKAFGAHVICTDLRPEARERAKELGADEVLETLPETSLNVDVVTDFVSAKSTFQLAQKHVRAKGVIVPVGLHSPVIEFDLNDLAFREVKILGSFWGTSQDQIECFDLIKKGVVRPVVENAKFADTDKLLEDLRAGKFKARVVVQPNDE